MTSSKYKYINFIIEPHKFNSLENMQNLKRKFLAIIQNTKFQLHAALTKNNIIMFSNQFVKVVMSLWYTSPFTLCISTNILSGSI
jgi:hypothetical protein